MSGKPFTLTAELTRKPCCPPAGPFTLAVAVCTYPLYAVLQAILNLANPNGSSEVEITAELPTVCPTRTFTAQEITDALAAAVAQRALCAAQDVLDVTRYTVNRNMNEDPRNMALYAAFRSQLYCPNDCTACPCPCACNCVYDERRVLPSVR